MSSSVLKLQDAPMFERHVLRAAGVSAALGLVHAVLAWNRAYLPMWYLAPAAALLSFALTSRAGAWMIPVGGAYTLVLAFVAVTGLPAAAPVLGAAAGGGMGLLRRLERSRAAAALVPGAWHVAFAAAAGAGLAVLGELVAQTLFARLQAFGVPLLLASPAVTASAGLFMGLAAAPAMVMLREDPVLSLAERVLPELSGRFSELAGRAVALYRDCGQALSALPPDPSRSELSRTLVKLGGAALEHAAEWGRVEAQLADPEAAQHGVDAERLRTELAQTQDPVAQQHLRVALSAHEEEAAHLAELRVERTRALARLEAEVALLAKARGALVGMRSGHAQLKSAELAALSRKLSSLASAQAMEAEVMSEVARGAELDQLTATRAV